MSRTQLLVGLALCLLPAAGPALAGQTASVSAPGLSVTVTAVDRSIFHVVAQPLGSPAPLVSPFVVEASAWPGASTRYDVSEAQVQTPAGMLSTRHLVVLLGGSHRTAAYSGRAVRVGF
jgi:hypothetical protein